MKEIRVLMGMPITVEVIDGKQRTLNKVFEYFKTIDEQFSPFKESSEVSQINKGAISKKYSPEMTEIMKLSEETKNATDGYFDSYHNGKFNPSGVVKGWAINKASQLLLKDGYKDFYVDAGGDIQAMGKNHLGKKWRVGIRNPFKINENVKIIEVTGMGVATSGTSIRGQHIYNPKAKDKNLTEIISLTVVGPNIYEADRFATPAFAMGRAGINFIEKLDGFEAYMIDKDGIATMTSGFERYVINE